jgi:hypothetical protein
MNEPKSRFNSSYEQDECYLENLAAQIPCTPLESQHQMNGVIRRIVEEGVPILYLASMHCDRCNWRQDNPNYVEKY